MGLEESFTRFIRRQKAYEKIGINDKIEKLLFHAYETRLRYLMNEIIKARNVRVGSSLYPPLTEGIVSQIIVPKKPQLFKDISSSNIVSANPFLSIDEVLSSSPSSSEFSIDQEGKRKKICHEYGKRRSRSIEELFKDSLEIARDSEKKRMVDRIKLYESSLKRHQMFSKKTQEGESHAQPSPSSISSKSAVSDSSVHISSKDPTEITSFKTESTVQIEERVLEKGRMEMSMSQPVNSLEESAFQQKQHILSDDGISQGSAMSMIKQEEPFSSESLPIFPSLPLPHLIVPAKHLLQPGYMQSIHKVSQEQYS
ncbi:hypothetical protein ADUPG1_008289, partial [Aduncisulcus paluster]